jgi:formylglycine-generating enzyme required for sulfatase activity
MGSSKGEEGRNNDEGPQHEVRIERPFALGRYVRGAKGRAEVS